MFRGKISRFEVNGGTAIGILLMHAVCDAHAMPLGSVPTGEISVAKKEHKMNTTQDL